jgi:hypothetical protein
MLNIVVSRKLLCLVLRNHKLVTPGDPIMAYFNTREVAAITMFAALWGVLSSIFAPIVFQMFGLPILCDMIGFAVLILSVWWIRKFGAVTAVGLIATVVNFVFNPSGFHFLGFTAASIVFDITARLMGYDRCLRKPSSVTVSMLSVSVLSAAAAGLIIGTFFMAAPALARLGGVLGWVGLHATGGAIGGFIGITLATGLSTRGVRRMEVRN